MYNKVMVKKIVKFVVSIVVSFAAGALGSLATIPNIPTWYAQLDKPPLLPPNNVFGPVWTALYLLMGTALYLVWTADSRVSKRPAFAAFGTQIVMNALWSIAFFGLHMPWAGGIIIIMLLGAIIWTMREFWKHSKLASYLLVPYIAWVCFATYLTFGVALLN